MSRLYSWFLGIAFFAVVSVLLVSLQNWRQDDDLRYIIGNHDPSSNTISQQQPLANGLSSALKSSKSRIRGRTWKNATTTGSTATAGGAPKQTKRQKIPPYHLVFSTSCEDQMDWESYVFFYHAWKVGQRGTVTRIASGCEPEKAEALKQFHHDHIASVMNPNKFHLHLTPDFSRSKEYIKTGSTRYKYMNKPYGLLHWMEHTFELEEKVNNNDLDGIVILMDPDMILLRPIVHDYTHQEVMFVEDDKNPPLTKVVKHGFPMAQQDGYLNNQWMNLNVSYITNGGNIRHVQSTDGPKHYNTGPPYLATVKDMYRIAQLWTDYAPRVYEIHPKLFAEMYGYIFATTELKLRHTLIQSLVVSTTEAHHREGWPYIDEYPDDLICKTLEPIPTTFSSTPEEQEGDSTILSSMTKLPVALHYCKRYLLQKWFFSKYRLKKRYISCETPLLQLPPADLVQRNYTYSLQPPPNGFHFQTEKPWDPPRIPFHQKQQAKREAFMICQLIRAVNEAAIHFKSSGACSNVTHTNWNTNYTFFNDPNSY